jgi:hypothetical protein
MVLSYKLLFLNDRQLKEGTIMSRSLSTFKQKRKVVKRARRINRSKKVKKGNPNPANSVQKRKAEKRKKREADKSKKIKNKKELAKQKANQISCYFKREDLDLLAKASGFLIKKSKLSPLHFFSVLVLTYFSGGDTSLILMATNLSDWFNISASAQAISARMKNKGTVNYFKQCLALSLETKLQPFNLDKKYNQCFPMFRGIKVGDSTSIELSESLSKPFKGSGGAASKSALKLNFVYDICNSLTKLIDIKSGSRSDKKLANGAVRCIKKGELLIRDLGFFSLNIFKKIMEKKAFYISRLLKGVVIYLNSIDNSIEIGEFLKKSTLNGKKIVDQEVFVGLQQLPARLIAFKVPKWVVKQRLKKYKAAQKKEPNEEYVIWSGYSVLITNISKDTCSAELIVELYSIRWQIELLFKSFKSTLKLSVVRGTSRNSVLCIIYAKLIGIVIAEKVISLAASICTEEDRELSVDKAIKWLKINGKFVQAILNEEIDQLILKLLLHQLKSICKDKRKKDISTQKKVLSVLQDPNNSFLHKQKKQKVA